MSAWDSQFNAFVTLLVTISPHSLAPLFLALTAGMNRRERNQVAVRSTLIGFLVLTIFALFGISILALFGITIPAFRVAGGLLLFYIAFEMIFERRQQRREQSAQTAITKDMIRNISAFPLAIPLIAGPGAISATILVADKLPSLADRAILLPAIALSHCRHLGNLRHCRAPRRAARRNRPVHPDAPARHAAGRAVSSVRGRRC